MHRFNTYQFTYNKQISAEEQSHSFTAQASDLIRGKEVELFTSLGDGNRIGFQLISHMTNNVIICYVRTTHFNEDHEITHWTLRPTEKSAKEFPHLKNITITIFNDI